MAMVNAVEWSQTWCGAASDAMRIGVPSRCDGGPTHPSPIGSRRPRPSRRFPPEVLTDHEVHRLLDACGHDGLTSLRNRALIAILYRAGLRISEALALEPKDLELDHGSIRVLRAKGGTYRTCGIDPQAAGIVQAWIDARQKWSPNEGHTHGRAVRSPAFCTRDGTALSTAYVRRLLPALARLANIPKRVHAHGLRHTHAAQLREEGLDVGIISKQLGHRSILTTIRYLDHVAPVAVVASVRKRAWLP